MDTYDIVTKKSISTLEKDTAKWKRIALTFARAIVLFDDNGFAASTYSAAMFARRLLAAEQKAKKSRR